jgi:hypothetical protein
VEWNTVTKVDLTTIASIVPRLLNVINIDVNFRDHITVFEHISKKSGQHDKKHEAMLLHAGSVGVVELHTHAGQMFPINALAGLVNDGSLLTVSPDGWTRLAS